jgi:hypothetical protein
MIGKRSPQRAPNSRGNCWAQTMLHESKSRQNTGLSLQIPE